MTLRVGIAGYGVVGRRRRDVIDARDDMKVVAVCDQSFSAPYPDEGGVTVFSDYRDLLGEELDALFVCLPNNVAAEVTIAGLERGLHVFCEKPPGRDVADIRRVREAEAAAEGLVLKYGFNHRYHYSVRDALEIVRSGELGEVINVRGVYGKSRVIPFSGGWRAERQFAGGGILLDQGIHMVDLMRLFCGDFTEVKSFVSNDYWKHDVEDNAYALMRDNAGRVAMLHSTATQWQHRFVLEIALSQGYLELRGILSGSRSYGSEKLIIGRRREVETGSDREEVVNYLDDHSWRDEIAEFADAVLRGGSIVSGSSADALATMELVYRIYCADPEWRDRYDIACP